MVVIRSSSKTVVGAVGGIGRGSGFRRMDGDERLLRELFRRWKKEKNFDLLRPQ